MNLNLKRYMMAMSLTLCGALVLSFQACTPDSSQGLDSSLQSFNESLKGSVKLSGNSGGGNGNGGGYEGKGSFYEVNPDACKDAGVPGEVVATQIDRTDTGFVITRENCRNIPSQNLDPQEVSNSDLTPEVLSVGGKILEKRTEKPSFSKVGDSYINIMCRGRIKNESDQLIGYGDGMLRVVKTETGFKLIGNFVAKVPRDEDLLSVGIGELITKKYSNITMQSRTPARPEVGAKYVSTQALLGEESLRRFAISLLRPEYQIPQKQNGTIAVPWEYGKDLNFYIPVWCDTLKKLPQN